MTFYPPQKWESVFLFSLHRIPQHSPANEVTHTWIQSKSWCAQKYPTHTTLKMTRECFYGDIDWEISVAIGHWGNSLLYFNIAKESFVFTWGLSNGQSLMFHPREGAPSPLHWSVSEELETDWPQQLTGSEALNKEWDHSFIIHSHESLDDEIHTFFKHNELISREGTVCWCISAGQAASQENVDIQGKGPDLRYRLPMLPGQLSYCSTVSSFANQHLWFLVSTFCIYSKGCQWKHKL